MNKIKTILAYPPHKILDFGNIENDYINDTVEFKNVCYKIRNNKILDKVKYIQMKLMPL